MQNAIHCTNLVQERSFLRNASGQASTHTPKPRISQPLQEKKFGMERKRHPLCDANDTHSWVNFFKS